MKSVYYIMMILLIVGIGGFFMFGGFGTSATGNAAGDNSGGNVQNIKLYVENGNYIMNPSEIKKDIPVRIEADMSRMPACSKSIVISAFNVRKTFTNNDNIVEFTPNKAGTFNIVCSMNMYRGTFTVR